jgi:hypothetical protein
MKITGKGNRLENVRIEGWEMDEIIGVNFSYD